MSTRTLPPPPTTQEATWVGTGHSDAADPSTAGAEAAAEATVDGTPSLLLVFCSAAGDPQAVVDGVRQHAGPDTVVAGMTAMGVLGSLGATDRGVVVLALGQGFEVRAVLARDTGDDQRGAGAAAAAAAAELTSDHRLFMLLCEGLSAEQHEVVRGAYGVLGAAVPLVGGCAADDAAWEHTQQFLGGADRVEVVTEAVVGIGIGARRRFHGLGVEHGWRRTGEPMVVTSSDSGVVHELDGRPALEVYAERTGIAAGLAQDAEAFRDAALARPIGLSRRTGEDLRVVHAADVATGSISCLSDVPQGALAWMMAADDADVVRAGVLACTTAVADHRGAPAAVLLFDCGARKVVLGTDGVQAEVAALAGASGVPVLGIYTFGEIARETGSRGMHNLTCAALALG